MRLLDKVTNVLIGVVGTLITIWCLWYLVRGIVVEHFHTAHCQEVCVAQGHTTGAAKLDQNLLFPWFGGCECITSKRTEVP